MPLPIDGIKIKQVNEYQKSLEDIQEFVEELLKSEKLPTATLLQLQSVLVNSNKRLAIDSHQILKVIQTLLPEAPSSKASPGANGQSYVVEDCFVGGELSELNKILNQSVTSYTFKRYNLHDVFLSRIQKSQVPGRSYPKESKPEPTPLTPAEKLRIY